jgi:hypothetical protein
MVLQDSKRPQRVGHRLHKSPVPPKRAQVVQNFGTLLQKFGKLLIAAVKEDH